MVSEVFVAQNKIWSWEHKHDTWRLTAQKLSSSVTFMKPNFLYTLAFMILFLKRILSRVFPRWFKIHCFQRLRAIPHLLDFASAEVFGCCPRQHWDLQVHL